MACLRDLHSSIVQNPLLGLRTWQIVGRLSFRLQSMKDSKRQWWSGYLIAIAVLLLVTVLVRRQGGGDDDFGSALPTHRNPALQSDYERIDKLAPLFTSLPKPAANDWLSKNPEGGQSFDIYVVEHQVPICQQYSEINLIALGDFTKAQLRLLAQTGDFLERFYGMPVRMLEPVSLANLPPKAQRLRDDGRSRQLLTTYLMFEVLKPRRTESAAALLGFVADDLWGGGDSNWVFGQAAISERVGVWSLFRNGNADGDENEFRLCLLRTLKTAAHETGHLFGMPHCVAFACGMNGSNRREESDRRPLEFCPECQAKLWRTCELDPQDRIHRLIEFSDDAGFVAEARFWRKLSDRLNSK